MPAEEEQLRWQAEPPETGATHASHGLARKGQPRTDRERATRAYRAALYSWFETALP